MAHSTFMSPAPIEVVELPWVAELAVRNDVFGQVIHPELTLEALREAYCADFDYLREAAVEIGLVALEHDLITASAKPEVRSGLYDPRINGRGTNLGPHYDLNPDQTAPGVSCFIATGTAGNAAIGEIAVLKPRPRERASSSNPAIQQAQEAVGMGTLFDLSNADVIPLKTNMLYLFPMLCVHGAPDELQPSGRNVFRNKDTRVA